MNLTNNEKNYNTINNYYKYKYNKKVYKISLNGNFGCPNEGRCTYCSSLGSGDFAGDKDLPLKEQFLEIKQMMENKWGSDALYIVYFQANTNTFASLSELKQKYEEAISLDKNIVGISISTRPDCLPKDVLDYLEELNKRIFVQIELGLQSSNNKTLELINRGHDCECFTNAVNELKKRNLSIVAHIINGLPYETKEDMLNTAKYVANLNIDGIKIHMLNILKNTKMGNDYINNPFKILDLNEYVEIVANQICLLPENMIIHRLTGDGPSDLLIEPKWILKKFVTVNEIDKYMRKHNLYQGSQR